MVLRLTSIMQHFIFSQTSLTSCDAQRLQLQSSWSCRCSAVECSALLVNV